MELIITLMKIEQKRKRRKSTFEFKDDELLYSWSEPDESWGFNVKYYDIDIENYSWSKERDRSMKFMFIPFLLIALLALIAASVSPEEERMTGIMVGVLWLIIGSVPLLIYIFSEYTMTTFNTRMGRLVVLDDGQKNQIIQEITERRDKLIQQLEMLHASRNLKEH